MEELLDLLKQRCSVRSFSYREVEQELIEKIIEAARVAPTARNNQPQRILVLKSKEALEKLQKCKQSHFNEQLAFIVCYNKNECSVSEIDSRSSGQIDAAIIATHMMLEAESLGVGSTWIMSFIPKTVIEEFGLDEFTIPVCVLVMGYKTDDYQPNARHFIRKDPKDFVKYL